MPSQALDVPPFVYAGLRTGAPDGPWVRLLALHLRERGSAGFLSSAMRQKIVWSGGTCVSEPNIDLAGDADWQIQDFFSEDLDLPNWTRVIVECDVDGSNRATAWTDEKGPQEADFVGGWKDPFWRYVDEHRTELDALGREAYG